MKEAKEGEECRRGKSVEGEGKSVGGQGEWSGSEKGNN